MDKIEEVKRILVDRAGDIAYGYYQEPIVIFYKDILTSIASKICQLFEPKPETISWLTKNPPPLRQPDESRLLTDEELAFELREAIRQNVSEDELSYPRIGALVSKTILPIIAKTASIKDAECQERVKRIFAEVEKEFCWIAGMWKDEDKIMSIRWRQWQALKKQEGEV